LYALTLPNINRFSKLFHCQNLVGKVKAYKFLGATLYIFIVTTRNTKLLSVAYSSWSCDWESIARG